MNSTERPDDVEKSPEHEKSPGHKESVEDGEPINTAVPIDPPQSVETPIVAEPPPAGLPASLETKTDTSHTLKVVRFETLARCGDEIWIENEGQIYRLRRTRQGKLILTK